MHSCITCRYPSLRVAYVDEKEEIGNDRSHPKVYSSKLVKVVNGFEQVLFYNMKSISLGNISIQEDPHLSFQQTYLLLFTRWLPLKQHDREL